MNASCSRGEFDSLSESRLMDDRQASQNESNVRLQDGVFIIYPYYGVRDPGQRTLYQEYTHVFGRGSTLLSNPLEI